MSVTFLCESGIEGLYEVGLQCAWNFTPNGTDSELPVASSHLYTIPEVTLVHAGTYTCICAALERREILQKNITVDVVAIGPEGLTSLALRDEIDNTMTIVFGVLLGILILLASFIMMWYIVQRHRFAEAVDEADMISNTKSKRTLHEIDSEPKVG